MEQTQPGVPVSSFLDPDILTQNRRCYNAIAMQVPHPQVWSSQLVFSAGPSLDSALYVRAIGVWIHGLCTGCRMAPAGFFSHAGATSNHFNLVYISTDFISQQFISISSVFKAVDSGSSSRRLSSVRLAVQICNRGRQRGPNSAKKSYQRGQESWPDTFASVATKDFLHFLIVVF